MINKIHMTLPKGYPLPKKEATASAEAEDKSRKEAEDKSRKEAEDKSRKEAEDKEKYSANSYQLTSNYYQDNISEYLSVFEKMKEAYLITMKEYAESYFRLLDFWTQNYRNRY